jgi:tripartite-type tricarboxylate transporter receptor subunit TctC
MAPAGTPTAVLTRLQAEIGKALESVSLRERMEKLGFEVSALASSEFNAYLVRDRARWARIITDRKLVIE